MKVAYAAGIYNLQEFDEEKKKYDGKIVSVKKTLASIEHEIEQATSYTSEELVKKIEEFKNKWKLATTAKEQNDLLKTFVKKIGTIGWMTK